MPAKRHDKVEQNVAAIYGIAGGPVGRKGRKHQLEGLSRLIWFEILDDIWKDEGSKQTEDSGPIRDLLERNG